MLREEGAGCSLLTAVRRVGALGTEVHGKV